MLWRRWCFFFFFKDTATTEIYTLSLHDALPISGDVVLFYSGYVDKYYKPFPEGNRLAWDPIVAGTAPAWPAPTPDAVEYLANKGVRHIAIDSPSMGPWGFSFEGKPMAQMTHVNFLKYGGSWTEFCRNIGQLPARGAYFISLSAKIVDMSGGLTRAIAIKPNSPLTKSALDVRCLI